MTIYTPKINLALYNKLLDYGYAVVITASVDPRITKVFCKHCYDVVQCFECRRG